MTEIDRLLVRIEADAAPLEGALNRLETRTRDVARGLDRDLAAAGSSAAGKAGELADAVDGLLAGALTGAIDSWEDLRRVALRALEDILQALLKTSRASGGLSFGSGGSGGGGGGLLGGLLGSALGGLLPGLAAGGPVEAGGAYRVGEAGPELFLPSSAGRVIPAGPSERLLSGASDSGRTPVQVQNNYAIDARGAQQGVGAEIAAALEARSQRIKAEAVDQVFSLMDRGGRYAKASGRRGA